MNDHLVRHRRHTPQIWSTPDSSRRGLPHTLRQSLQTSKLMLVAQACLFGFSSTTVRRLADDRVETECRAEPHSAKSAEFDCNVGTTKQQ